MDNRDVVGKALGKVPSGLYVVTSKKGDNIAAFTASFLVQVAFDPPLIAMSVKKGRGSYDVITEAGVFAVNIMSKDMMKVVGQFAKPRPEGETGLDEVSHEDKTLGVPVLTDSLAYLECKVYSTTEAGDHMIIIGEVVNGELLKEGEPAVHIRKNGFNY
jgi:3-hydroxy-9,10-secoandrosta-1,3,5(10)-triene-9,17-dione monooxygenase reductase component